MARKPEYATKRELEMCKKYCEKQLKDAMKHFKQWDVKQDKKLVRGKK